MGLNRKKLKHKNKGGGGGAFKEGDNTFRILPRSMKYFTDDDDDFVYQYLVHYVPTLGDESTTIVCPSNEGKVCPICMISKALYNTGSKEDEELAGKLYKRKRFLMNAVKLDVDDMGTPNMNKVYGVEAIEFAQKTVHDGLLTFMVNDKWGELLDPVEGRNFCITMVPKAKTESGYNEYKTAPDPDITKIKLAKSWKKSLDALAETMPEASSYDVIYNALISSGLFDSIDDMPKAVRNLFQRELSTASESSVVDKGMESAAAEEEYEAPDVPDPEPEDPPEEAEPAQPDCFGVEYSPKKAKCKKCPVKHECLHAFIESDE